MNKRNKWPSKVSAEILAPVCVWLGQGCRWGVCVCRVDDAIHIHNVSDCGCLSECVMQ